MSTYFLCFGFTVMGSRLCSFGRHFSTGAARPIAPSRVRHICRMLRSLGFGDLGPSLFCKGLRRLVFRHLLVRLALHPHARPKSFPIGRNARRVFEASLKWGTSRPELSRLFGIIVRMFSEAVRSNKYLFSMSTIRTTWRSSPSIRLIYLPVRFPQGEHYGPSVIYGSSIRYRWIPKFARWFGQMVPTWIPRRSTNGLV